MPQLVVTITYLASAVAELSILSSKTFASRIREDLDALKAPHPRQATMKLQGNTVSFSWNTSTTSLVFRAIERILERQDAGELMSLKESRGIEAIECQIRGTTDTRTTDPRIRAPTWRLASTSSASTSTSHPTLPVTPRAMEAALAPASAADVPLTLTPSKKRGRSSSPQPHLRVTGKKLRRGTPAPSPFRRGRKEPCTPVFNAPLSPIEYDEQIAVIVAEDMSMGILPSLSRKRGRSRSYSPSDFLLAKRRRGESSTFGDQGHDIPFFPLVALEGFPMLADFQPYLTPEFNTSYTQSLSPEEEYALRTPPLPRPLSPLDYGYGHMQDAETREPAELSSERVLTRWSPLSTGEVLPVAHSPSVPRTHLSVSTSSVGPQHSILEPFTSLSYHPQSPSYVPSSPTFAASSPPYCPQSPLHSPPGSPRYQPCSPSSHPARLDVSPIHWQRDTPAPTRAPVPAPLAEAQVAPAPRERKSRFGPRVENSGSGSPQLLPAGFPALTRRAVPRFPVAEQAQVDRSEGPSPRDDEDGDDDVGGVIGWTSVYSTVPKTERSLLLQPSEHTHTEARNISPARRTAAKMPSLHSGSVSSTSSLASSLPITPPFVSSSNAPYLHVVASHSPYHTTPNQLGAVMVSEDEFHALVQRYSDLEKANELTLTKLALPSNG